MKLISKEYKMLGNALNAHKTEYLISVYEIEQSDVDKVKQHKEGYRHSEYTFKKKDVGKQIITYFRKGKNNYHHPIIEQFWHFRQNT